MRVLITRPRQEAEDFATALQEMGAQIFFLPTIAIQPVFNTSPLDRALTQLKAYTWLVFSSANAVKVVVDRLDALGIKELPESLRVATVGPKTAARLMEK